MSAREELEFGGLHNSLARNRTPKGRCYEMQNASTERGILELGERYTLLGARNSANVLDVGWGLGYGKFNCNETQRLTCTGTPTGGSVRLTWINPSAVSDTTAIGAVPYNCTATQMYDALQAMATIELGDVTVAGGPWPTYPIDVTFKGRYGRTDVNMITLSTNSLTGGTAPSVGIAERVKGGLAEEYLAVVQHNGESTARVYSVHPTTGVYTQLATGLTASNWFFIQYRDRIYAANASDGLLYKQLGGTWSESLGTPSFGNPTVKPTISTLSVNEYEAGAGSAGTFSGWGSNPTIVIEGNAFKITLAANLANATVSFVWTFTATSDWQYDSYASCFAAVENTNLDELDPSRTDIQLINNDASPITMSPVLRDNGETYVDASPFNKFRRHFHFGNVNRADRDNVKKIVFTFTFTKGVSGNVIYVLLSKLKEAISDRMPTFDIEDGPIRRSITHGFTYYQVSTGIESRMSLPLESEPLPFVKSGAWVGLIAPGNANLTTSDLIKFYRKDGTGQWRLIGQVANVTSGNSTVCYDKNMVDDLVQVDTYGVVTLPGGINPEQLGLFKQCLVVVGDQKLWISAVGKPLVFAHDPEDLSAPLPDELDVDRPRTVFLSDNRADDGYAIVGQDSLYGISPLSSYAMVGDKPATLSPPRRLPGSRGCLGYRAGYALGGGTLVGSQDGLWYYSVGRGFSGEDNGALAEREETAEVRRSWITTLVAGSASGMCIAELNNEIWAFNGTKFLKQTRNLKFEEGTFTDSVQAVHSSRERGLAFTDSRGRLHKMGAYTTDGDALGAALSWSYTTGILDGPRTKLTGIEVQAVGKPRVTIQVYDGKRSLPPVHLDTPVEGQVNRFPFVVNPGWRYQITVTGNAADKVESLVFEFEEASKAKAN